MVRYASELFAKGDIRELRALWKFLQPYRAQLAAALVAMAIAAGSFLAIGEALKRVVDLGFAGGDTAALHRTLLIVVAIAAVQGVATFCRYALFTWLAERFVADVRRAVFDHAITLSPGYFEKTRTGEVISRLTNDTQRLEAAVLGVFSYMLRNLTMMAGGIAMLAVTSLQLTLAVVAAVPIVVAPLLLLGRRVRRLSAAMQDRLAESAACVDETFREIRVVQAYAHEAQDRRRFAAHVERVFAAGATAGRFGAVLVSTVIVLAFVAIAFVLWIGGTAVIDGRISPGDLSAFVFYAATVAASVLAVSETWADLQRAAGAAERLLDVLATKPEIQAPAAPVALPAGRRATAGVAPTGLATIRRGSAVRFDAVTFFYPTRPDAASLADLSLDVRPGELVALVGPSGAGKTTVFQLLLRFYDPQRGSIAIDGVDLRLADPADVRRHVAIVTQEPVIFADSLIENVRYGCPDATREEVVEACRAANCLDFIERLPEGLHTYLGERGTRLSGGQRQRIALARAFLADRSILLLDEATSALDAESERMVQQAMERLKRGRTTLTIAHRLASIQSADRIVVLDHGRIVATGTHAELVEQGGLYARQAALQFGVV